MADEAVFAVKNFPTVSTLGFSLLELDTPLLYSGYTNLEFACLGCAQRQ
jgi:hypothetical protein